MDYRIPMIATFHRIRLKACHRRDEQGREIYRLAKENIQQLEQEIRDEQSGKCKASPRVLSDIEVDFLDRTGEPKLPLTSLPGLNRKIWGLKDGGITIVGARTSQGKSSFAMQCAWDLADAGNPVLFLSLEMDEKSLIERLFCHVSKVDNYDIKTGKWNTDPEIQTRWRSFKNIVDKTPLLITCGVGHTWREIVQIIECVDPKPKAIIVDYIQNIHAQAGETRETINQYLRQFRALALKERFAGIICSQINRGSDQGKDKEPTMAQLKESGFLEEIADVVMLLHWPDFYTKEVTGESSEYKIIVEKNRSGRTGEHRVYYTPRYYLFREEIPESDRFEERKESFTGQH